jgi:hypothetical protein
LRATKDADDLARDGSAGRLDVVIGAVAQLAVFDELLDQPLEIATMFVSQAEPLGQHAGLSRLILGIGHEGEKFGFEFREIHACAVARPLSRPAPDRAPGSA